MKRRQIDEYAVLSNREKTLLPRTNQFWCEFCDGDLVKAGGRCDRCGKRSCKRRFK